MIKNITFSLVSFASSLILAFFVSPMILRNLGDARYGVWALFGEMLTYYSLLDFGIRGAVNYFAGRCLAQRDEAGVRRFVSSGFYGLLALSSIAFVITVALIFALQHVFVPDGLNKAEVLASACVFVALFCASLPIETFAAVLVGSRRAYLVSTTEVMSRLLSTSLMIVALMTARNILLLCAAQFIGRISYWTLVIRHTHKYVPEAKLCFSDASFGAIRDLLRYGSKNAVISVSGILMSRKDVTVIAIFLGPQWAATFTFARMAVQSLYQACTAITQPVRPNLIYHWARGEYERTYDIYYKITRYSAFVVLMNTAFLVPFGPDFLRLWIGPRFVTGNIWFRADVVLFLLLGAQVPRMIYSMSWQLLFAQDRQKAMTVLTVIEAAVNTALSIALVQSYGTVGLAFAAFLPTVASQFVVFPIMIRKLAGISLRRYITDGVGRPLLGSVAVVWAGFVLRSWAPVHNWRGLFADAAILAALAMTIGAVFVVHADDRRRVMSALTSVGVYIRSQRAASNSA